MKAVIIGAGLAGLTTALSLAPMPVIVLSAKKLGEGISSGWSQGGIAAAVGSHDTAQLHAADTLKAGAGLSDASIARQVTEDGASIIDQLINTGVNFDRDEEGRLRLGLEAAHSQRRIVHAAGDGTGAAIMKALIRAVKLMPSIEVIEDACASDILTHSGAVSGVLVEIKGKASIIPTNAVVLATGGAGALWQHTTNPLSSWGQGLALAARAGAVLGDLEFMQFHPTAIDCGRDPMPLASEALRGEGALLIDENNQRFVDELQPRDIVARAIWQHMQKGHRVFLDARQSIGSSFSKRFPSIYASCMTAHIDPSLHPIPVRPAAHYHMGGVMTGAEGRSTVEGLWACGEVACTGLHGANRLASNSLLEAASFGRRVALDIKHAELKTVLAPQKMQKRRNSDQPHIRNLMSNFVGVTRDQKALQTALAQLAPLASISDMALVGLMITTAALKREESRGAHNRIDYPETNETWARHQTFTLADFLPQLSNVAGA